MMKLKKCPECEGSLSINLATREIFCPLGHYTVDMPVTNSAQANPKDTPSANRASGNY